MSGPIRGIDLARSLDAARDVSPAPKPGDASFGDVFKRVLGDTSGLEADSRDLIAAFLRGEPVELHQVVAASEEASISLELLVGMRNKFVEAYRTVMNLQ
jgi:flagellar hook-basal body complex protein FliE